MTNTVYPRHSNDPEVMRQINVAKNDVANQARDSIEKFFRVQPTGRLRNDDDAVLAQYAQLKAKGYKL